MKQILFGLFLILISLISGIKHIVTFDLSNLSQIESDFILLLGLVFTSGVIFYTKKRKK